MSRGINAWINALLDEKEKLADAEATAIRYVKIWVKARAKVRRMEQKIAALSRAIAEEELLKLHVDAHGSSD